MKRKSEDNDTSEAVGATKIKVTSTSIVNKYFFIIFNEK